MTAAPASRRPSLHDIAAMPHSQTRTAIQQHYDPDWGSVSLDGDGAFEFRVEIEWSYRSDETETITVRANTEDEARQMARDIWEDEIARGEDPELNDISVSRVSS